MKARPPPQPQLFGPAPPPRRDASPVTIPLVEVSSGTAAAWHLAPMGRRTDTAKFAPRSLVSRGEGEHQQLFTMPRWIASERGWL